MQDATLLLLTAVHKPLFKQGVYDCFIRPDRSALQTRLTP